MVPEALTWLWNAVVARILPKLPPTAITPEGLPRVWWMPTGLLSLLPLHAAGHPGEPGALDAVISSYTPTLRALARARTRPPATDRRHLIVAVEHTHTLPDACTLPGATTEARNLDARYPGKPLLLDHNATTTNVLAALSHTTWAHFACHASINPAAPSRSALHLHDAALPIPDISQLQLSHAELAYLSACSTAATGWQHTDEALNLDSAFQLAGYRHVIASLWPLDDAIVATAADTFYTHLPATAAADAAARTLHLVAHALRTQHPKHPHLWAPLIHNGP